MFLLLLHIRERLFPNGDDTEQIFIENNTVHEHPVLNIEYTSYDVQRERDIVHVGYGRTGVMVYTPTLGGDEPWSYANVLDIYHVIIRTASNPKPKRLTVLWVRWMERSASGLTGLNSKNYTRVSFVPSSNTPGSTFDFIDPSHIIRSCHLIPAFDLGRTNDLLDPSMARDMEGDWCAYYVNRCGPDKFTIASILTTVYGQSHRFVDRDAFARFAGIGIGCQRFQSSRVLEIQSGPDFDVNLAKMQEDTSEPTEQDADTSGGY